MVKKLIMMLFVLMAVGMAVPQTRAKIEESGIQPVKDAMGVRIVPRRLEAMADQLDVRLGRAEGLPGNFEGWLRRDFSSSSLDPWDNLYYLRSGRRDYSVGSMGPDRIQGTDDDIVVTRRLPAGR